MANCLHIVETTTAKRLSTWSSKTTIHNNGKNFVSNIPMEGHDEGEHFVFKRCKKKVCYDPITDHAECVVCNAKGSTGVLQIYACSLNAHWTLNLLQTRSTFQGDIRAHLVLVSSRTKTMYEL